MDVDDVVSVDVDVVDVDVVDDDGTKSWRRGSKRIEWKRDKSNVQHD
jgi:hypothetical protein